MKKLTIKKQAVFQQRLKKLEVELKTLRGEFRVVKNRFQKALASGSAVKDARAIDKIRKRLGLV